MRKRVRDLVHKVDPYEMFDETRYPDDLQGWGGHPEFFEEMVKEARAVRALEVGTWKGRSAVAIGQALKKHFNDFYVDIYDIECALCGRCLIERDHAMSRCPGPQPELVCVDTWLGATEFYGNFDDETRYGSLKMMNGYPQVYYQFLANMKSRGLQDVVTPFAQSSTNALRFLGSQGIKFDLIYIDGSHEYDDVKLDLEYSWPLLKSGGVLVGDDYTDYWKGVKDAVRTFFDGVATVEHRQLPGEKYPSDYWIVRKK